MHRKSLLRLSRLMLPAAFLGYAAYANLAALTGGEALRLAQVEGSLVRGEATENLSANYARAMPHREPAVAWLGAARYLLAGEGRDGVAVGEGGWLFSEEELVRASEAQIARAVEEAVAAQEWIGALGGQLVVVPLPAKIDIDREQAPDEWAASAMEAQHQDFLEALASRGVAAVDVRPALTRLARQNRAFLARDTHWTPQGAEAAARAVALSGLVQAGQEAFLRRDGRPEAVEGDLVSFVTSADLAGWLGLGPEEITSLVAEPAGGDPGGIFAADAPAISTLLVGTSYSADDRWSFAPSLSLALSRDVLNLAKEGQGPVRPLRSLLHDPAWAETPPDYVIWEFPVRYLGDPSIWPDDLRADLAAAPQGSP